MCSPDYCYFIPPCMQSASMRLLRFQDDKRNACIFTFSSPSQRKALFFRSVSPLLLSKIRTSQPPLVCLSPKKLLSSLARGPYGERHSSSCSSTLALPPSLSSCRRAKQRRGGRVHKKDHVLPSKHLASLTRSPVSSRSLLFVPHSFSSSSSYHSHSESRLLPLPRSSSSLSLPPSVSLPSPPLSLSSLSSSSSSSTKGVFVHHPSLSCCFGLLSQKLPSLLPISALNESQANGLSSLSSAHEQQARSNSPYHPSNRNLLRMKEEESQTKNGEKEEEKKEERRCSCIFCSQWTFSKQQHQQHASLRSSPLSSSSSSGGKSIFPPWFRIYLLQHDYSHLPSSSFPCSHLSHEGRSLLSFTSSESRAPSRLFPSSFSRSPRPAAVLSLCEKLACAGCSSAYIWQAMRSCIKDHLPYIPHHTCQAHLERLYAGRNSIPSSTSLPALHTTSTSSILLNQGDRGSREPSVWPIQDLDIKTLTRLFCLLTLNSPFCHLPSSSSLVPLSGSSSFSPTCLSRDGRAQLMCGVSSPGERQVSVEDLRSLVSSERDVLDTWRSDTTEKKIAGENKGKERGEVLERYLQHQALLHVLLSHAYLRFQKASVFSSRHRRGSSYVEAIPTPLSVRELRLLVQVYVHLVRDVDTYSRYQPNSSPPASSIAFLSLARNTIYTAIRYSLPSPASATSSSSSSCASFISASLSSTPLASTRRSHTVISLSSLVSLLSSFPSSSSVTSLLKDCATPLDRQSGWAAEESLAPGRHPHLPSPGCMYTSDHSTSLSLLHPSSSTSSSPSLTQSRWRKITLSPPSDLLFSLQKRLTEEGGASLEASELLDVARLLALQPSIQGGNQENGEILLIFRVIGDELAYRLDELCGDLRRIDEAASPSTRTDVASPPILSRREGDPSMVRPSSGERKQLADSPSCASVSSPCSRDLYDLFYTRVQRKHERESFTGEATPTKDLIGTPRAALHAVQSFAEANVVHEPFFSNLSDFLLSPPPSSSCTPAAAKAAEAKQERRQATSAREISSLHKEEDEETYANTGSEDCEAPASPYTESIVWLDLWKSREICELLFQFRRLGYTSCDDLLTYLWSAYDDCVLSRGNEGGATGERKKKEVGSSLHESSFSTTSATEEKTRRRRRRGRNRKDEGKESLVLAQKKASLPDSFSPCEVGRSREGFGETRETSSSSSASLSSSISSFATKSREETRKKKIRLYGGCTPPQLSCLLHMAAYGDVPPPPPQWQHKLIKLLLSSSSSSPSASPSSSSSSASIRLLPSTVSAVSTPGHPPELPGEDDPYRSLSVSPTVDTLQKLSPAFSPIEAGALCASLLRLTPLVATDFFYRTIPPPSLPSSSSSFSSSSSSFSHIVSHAQEKRRRDESFLSSLSSPLPSSNKEKKKDKLLLCPSSVETLRNPPVVCEPCNQCSLSSSRSAARRSLDTGVNHLACCSSSHALHYDGICRKTSSLRFLQEIPLSYLPAFCTSLLLHVPPLRIGFPHKSGSSRRRESISFSPSADRPKKVAEEAIHSRAVLRRGRRRRCSVGKKDLLKEQQRKLAKEGREEEEEDSFLFSSSFSSSLRCKKKRLERGEEDQVEEDEDHSAACSLYWPRDVRRSLFSGWKVLLARLLDLWKRSAASSYASLLRHALVYQQLTHPFLGRSKRDNENLLLISDSPREREDKAEKKKIAERRLFSFSSPSSSSSCSFLSSSSLSQTPSSLSLLAALYLYNPLREYEGGDERHTRAAGQFSPIEKKDEREEEKRRRKDEIVDDHRHQHHGDSACMRPNEELSQGKSRKAGRSNVDNEREKEEEEEEEERREEILKGETNKKSNSDEEHSQLQVCCSRPSEVSGKKNEDEVRDISKKKREKNQMISKTENVSLLSLSSSSAYLSQLKERQEDEEEEKEEKEKDSQISSKRAVHHHHQHHHHLSSPLFRGVFSQLPVFLTPRWADSDPYLSMITKKEERFLSEPTRLEEKKKTEQVYRQRGLKDYHRGLENKAIQIDREQLQDGEKEERRTEEVCYIDEENSIDREEMKRENNENRDFSVSTEVLDTRLSTAARLCRQTLLSLLVYVHLSFSETHLNTLPISKPSSTALSPPVRPTNNLLSSCSFDTSAPTTSSQKNVLSRCSSPVSVSLRSLSLTELRDIYLLTILTTSRLLWADSGPGTLGVKARNLPSISKKAREKDEEIRIDQTSLLETKKERPTVGEEEDQVPAFVKEKKEREEENSRDDCKVFRHHNRQESSDKRKEVREEESSSSSVPPHLRCTDTPRPSRPEKGDSLDQGVHLRVLLQQVLLDRPEEEQRLLRFLRDEKDEEMNEEASRGVRLKGQRRKTRHRKHLKSTLWNESASFALYTASRRLQVAWKEREKEKENSLVGREKARRSHLEQILERRRGESHQHISCLSLRENEEEAATTSKGGDRGRGEVVVALGERERRREDTERDKIEGSEDTVEKKLEKADDELNLTGTPTRSVVMPPYKTSSSSSIKRTAEYQHRSEEREESMRNSILSPSSHLSHREEASPSFSSSDLPSPSSSCSERALRKSRGVSRRSRTTPPSSPSVDKDSLLYGSGEPLWKSGRDSDKTEEDSSPFLSSRLDERFALAEAAARSLFFTSDVCGYSSDKKREKKREGIAPSGSLEIKTSKFHRQVLSSLYAGLQLYQQFQPRSKDLSSSSSSQLGPFGERRTLCSKKTEERERLAGREVPANEENGKKKRRGSGSDKEEEDDRIKAEEKAILMELEEEKKEKKLKSEKKREIRGVEGRRNKRTEKKVEEKDIDPFSQRLFHSFSVDQEVPVGPYTIDLVVSMQT